MRKKNEITEYVAAALIFVCAVAVSLGIFLVCTQNSIERNSQKVIKTNVSRQSEHIKAILDIHYGYLRGIAKEIGKSEELVLDENMEMLISLEEETALERTALIEADGTAHYDTGDVKNVSHRRYFNEAVNGQQTLSDPIESSVDKEVRVVLGVPVLKDGEIAGILGGSYNVTALSHMMFDDLFGGNGYSLITDKDGNVITYDRVYSEQEQEVFSGNIFDYFDNCQIRTAAIQDIKTDFAAGEEGIREFRFSAGRKPFYYIGGSHSWAAPFAAHENQHTDAWYPFQFSFSSVSGVSAFI